MFISSAGLIGLYERTERLDYEGLVRYAAVLGELERRAKATATPAGCWDIEDSAVQARLLAMNEAREQEDRAADEFYNRMAEVQ